MLRAAAELSVRRVVITSSIEAIFAGHPRAGSHVFDESDFSRLDVPLTAYDRSKSVAEMAAWEYVRSLSDDRRLELTTINPGFALGPILTRDPGVTNEVILKLVRRQMPGLPNMNFALVDVRDIADLHYRAMVTKEANGRRICCALPNVHISENAAILSNADYRIPTRRLPDWLVRLTAVFDKKVALIVGDLGKRWDFDSTRAKNLLGWEPRSIESTVLDAVKSFKQQGLL